MFWNKTYAFILKELALQTFKEAAKEFPSP